MIGEAITYLRESDDAVRTVIIGGILSLFAFLIVPLFAIAGYLVRVLDRTASGDDEAPVFDDWGDLIVDGAKASVIAFVYALVPAVVLAAFALSSGLLGATGSDVLGAIGGIWSALGTVLGFALVLGIAYVVPAAVANFAEKRTLASGFEIDTLRRVLVDRTYATGWLMAFLVIVAGSVISGLLNVVPIVGTIASAFVGFYVAVSAYYILGHTWGEIRHLPVRGRPEARRQPQL
jgi:hypothetical protein